jgi:hypothetical protein
MLPQSTQLPLVEETWLPVPDYEGLYEVSDLGNVRRDAPYNSTHAGRILKPRLSPSGYLSVDLCRDNRAVHFRVNRLVLAAFTRPPRPGEQGNHINGIKTDNRLANLEWTEPVENIRHAHRVGLAPPPPPSLRRGSQCPGAKLTEADVLTIRAARGQVTGPELARRFGVSKNLICRIQLRKTWRHI